MTIGQKFDSGKPPVVRGFMDYFPNAISEVARVSAFGANKYAWGNWRFVNDGFIRYSEALGRHLLQQGVDRESDLLHAAHAAWNAMARLELLLSEPDIDLQDELPFDAEIHRIRQESDEYACSCGMRWDATEGNQHP